MYFDPLSAWLVALISDGIIIAGEKFGGNSAKTEYDRKRIKQENEWLNDYIRREKEKFGLILPEHTYEDIQRKIISTKNSSVFKSTNAPIVIDLDNQEYIIDILEECAKRFSKYASVEKCRQKAEWYKNASVEARRKKEQYAKELEENRIKKAKEQEKQQTTSNILLVIGLVIFVGFIIFFFS